MDSQEPFDAYEPEPVDAVTAVSDQGWLTPAKLPGDVSRPIVSGVPMYDLRPLTLGEILDRTFSVLRAKFWLFAGIAAGAAALQSIVQCVQITLQNKFLGNVTAAGQKNALPDFEHMHLGVGAAFLVVMYLLIFLTAAVTQAATAYAVSEVYLGRPVTIVASFRATVGGWLKYIGIALWMAGSMMWVPLVIIIPGILLLVLMKSTGWAILGGLLVALGFMGGFVVGYILYLRNALAIPSTVIERLSIRASMKRSKVLTPGAKFRIFMVTLIAGCLLMVVGVMQMPFSMMVAFAMVKGHSSVIGQAGLMVVNFVGQSVVVPVIMIGTTLVYFDQRVRKEAFDIAVMLRGSGAAVDDAGV